MNYKLLTPDSLRSLQSGNSKKAEYNSEELNLGIRFKNRLFLFKDEFSNLHFAIALVTKKEGAGVVDPKIFGLRISIDEFILKFDNVKGWYLNFACTDERLVSIFCAFVKELCQELESTVGRLNDKINRVIRRWKAFWSIERLVSMSDQTLIGLFAELVIFRDLAKKNSFIALDSWRGPMKERHDFLLNNFSIEVKATTLNKKTYTIHGLDQMMPFPNKILHLATFDVKLINNSKSVSLVELINEIILNFKGDLTSEDKFMELLSKSGYSPIFNDTLSGRKVEVLSASLYQIDDKFPALTSGSLDKILSSVVTNVQYDLNLTTTKSEEYNARKIVKMI